jgi:glycolate oxidase FAD binding subunit
MNAMDTIQTKMPQRPTTTAELAEKIRAAGTARMQVRITGSNSLPIAGFETGRDIQEISTLRMNKVLEHAVGDMTVIVQAGISLEALQRQLAWQNQWLPIDPPNAGRGTPGQRTVGGLIATNSLGPLRFGCGDWRLLVMGMTWVDGNGTIIKGGGRTVKNVAGYNTPRLMIGACGTLGAIAEVTLRTFARPMDEQCVIFFCENVPAAETLLADAMESSTTPAYVQAIGGGTFSTNPLQLPTTRKGIAIVVGFLDRPASCAAQIETLRTLPSAHGVDSISQTAAQAGRLRLWMTTEPAVEADRGFGFRIAVLSSEVCNLIGNLEAAARKSNGEAWAVSEAGTGIVRGIINGVDLAVVRELLSAHAAGAQLLLTQTTPPDLRATGISLSARIKQELDPQNVFGIASAAGSLAASPQSL